MSNIAGKQIMFYLGVFDGTHDAGAVLLKDGFPIFASNEERYTGEKGAGGWPTKSIADALSRIPSQTECTVAFAGQVNPNPVLRLWRKQQKNWKLDGDKYFTKENSLKSRSISWIQHQSPFPYLRSEHVVTRSYLPFIKRRLQKQLQDRHTIKPHQISIEDHHHCHAAAGHFTSGWPNSLIIVADGVGDGLALSIWHGQKERLSLLRSVPYPHSLGLVFASITGHLGYRPFRHEGKLVGLAARGRAERIPLRFPQLGHPLEAQLNVMLGQPLKKWLAQVDTAKPEDVAAWLQQGLTESIEPLVRWWIRETGLRHVVLVGGIFANVELNRVLLGTGADQYSIYPHMGDGGLAMGAAMIAAHRDHAWRPRPFTSLALGPELDTPSIDRRTKARGLKAIQTDHSAEIELAERLAKGEIVARATGRMEYGPRALGQRSILAPATHREIHTELNRRLNRSETMPFAPVMLIEDLNRWVTGTQGAQSALPWMTVNVKAKPEFKALCPAVVHVDDTLRPQVVSAKNNPELYTLLHHYRRKTGIPALINTSFNLHEHPIVRTVSDAINAAQKANIRCIQLDKKAFEY